MADLGRKAVAGQPFSAPPRRSRTIEREQRLASLAAKQGRAIGHDQLLRLGFTREAIRQRLRSGRIQRRHLGVYIVGPGHLDKLGEHFAALLACRPDPLISNISALARMGLAKERGIVHVTTTNRGAPRNLRGVTVHRVRRLDPADVTRIDDLPCTTLPRSLLDIAETEPRYTLEKAFEAAERKGDLDLGAIQACAARNPGRRGIKPLLSLVAEYVAAPGSHEGMEREFQLLLREEGLPLPACNVLVCGQLVDCHWPADDFVVELDSKGFHKSWAARERDMVRDANLLRNGIATLRVTWRRMRHERAALVGDIAANTERSASLR